MTDIQKRLFALQDKGYQAGSVKLNPSVDPDTIIGVRIPALRNLAKELKDTEEATDFVAILPHAYFEEYQLHSFIIGYLKDFDRAIAEAERLLPYLNSWALTDSMRFKAFDCDQPYTIRYGILCLMNYFLDDRFDDCCPAMVAAVHFDEYYVMMMQAWYFATALAKQYEAILPYIKEHRLDKWVHNKTIQKAVESYRITDEQKAYLKTLKIK